VIRCKSFYDSFDSHWVEWSCHQIVVIDISRNERLHEVEISHLTVDLSLEPLNSYDSVTKDTKDKIFAFIVFNAK